MSDPLLDTDHVEMTVQRMAELHAEHDRSQTPMQRRVVGLTSSLAHPGAVASVVLVALIWMAVNGAAGAFGFKPFDAPPFALLELIATLAALITTMMILATQAREEEAARHRSQLTLQLASLSEQKIAKVIRLLEEQRRDSSALPDRRDDEAESMATPSDPKHVLDRIKDTHE